MSGDHNLFERMLLEQKNKYRGLVSKFKSKAYVPDRTMSQTMRFRSDLLQLLLDSRAILHPSSFSTFNEWIVGQNRKQLPELLRSPIGFEELSGVKDAAPVPLEVELHWVSERIRANSQVINQYRAYVEVIEALAFSGEFDTAISMLQMLESETGVSLWSVQLRIALEQQAGGLERQKRYTTDVRAVYKRGLLAFMTFNTSVRNEERTTISKYRDDIRAKIDKHRYYADSVKTYMRYRLAFEMPGSEEGLADILRVEQSHNLADVYEGFLSVAQEIVRHKKFKTVRNTLLKCLLRLSDIEDFRVKQLIVRLDSAQIVSPLPARQRDVSDLLFEGRVVAARRACRRRAKSFGAVDPWDLVYDGLACAHGIRASKAATRIDQCSVLIGAVFSRRNDFAESYARLVKLALNLRGLSAASGLLEMLSQLKRGIPDEEWRPWLISLNSPTRGIEDLEPSADGSRCLLDSYGRARATEAAWTFLHNPECLTDELSNPGTAVLAAVGHLNKAAFASAIRTLAARSSDFPYALRSIYAPVLLHGYYANGDRQSVVALLAEEGAIDDGYAEALPIVSSIGHLKWPDFSLVENPLAPSIALHQLWLMDGSDATASTLRFAAGRALKKLDVRRPSELIEFERQFNKHELIYFMRKVCTPNVLDVARILKGSRAIMEERQAICASLRLLNPENSSLYEDEVMSISNQLALDEGQWLVDRTRLHVDTDAFSRWAVKELAEDFARYQDLLGIDVTEAGDFEDVLSEIESAALSPSEPLLAQGEADAVLYALLRRAAAEFVNNPIFGLDFYLSKRIRHQSFVGLIRGPLEFSQLITTRKSESSEYHRNDFWLEKFDESGDLERDALDEAFKKFATKFDDILLTAKETRFHVRSHEKPEGLLSLDLPLHMVAIARTISRHDTDISGFVDTLIALLWASLEKSLANARSFISEDLKTRIVEASDELRMAARRCVEGDPAFLELDMAIGKCSAEVQRKLDEAAAWFTRADLNAHMRLFTLDQIVRVATDSALRCQRAFEPAIRTEVSDSDHLMMASTLIFVHDVIFVALDNARAHSGLKSPKVKIGVDLDTVGGSLTINVRSESKMQNRQVRERKLSETRKLIALGQIEPRTRKEGESGFFKLAAVVRQSNKGIIDFGFTPNGEFFLKIVYAMSIRQVSPELEPA